MFISKLRTIKSCIPVRHFAKTKPRYIQDDEDKINKLPLNEYFADFMRRRPSTQSGYINLSKVNFKVMSDKVETSEDLDVMIDAYLQYIGHRNTLPHSYMDNILMKGLKLKEATKFNQIWENHQHLMYFPSKQVFKAYHKYYMKSDSGLKEFFESTKGKWYLKKSSTFYKDVITKAYAEEDKQLVVDAYLDILQTNKANLGNEVLNKVIDSLDLPKEHVVFEEITNQVTENKDLSMKLFDLAYCFNKGEDITILIQDLKGDISKIPNNEYLKKALESIMKTDQGNALSLALEGINEFYNLQENIE